MKRLISFSALLSAAAFAMPVTAADTGACASLSQQLRARTAEFVKVKADGRNPSQAGKATPADFQRGVSERDSALHAIANDVWSVRADMASRDCPQAAGFAY